MSLEESDEGFDTTIYLWGMGGKRTMLPSGVGFKVGANTRIKYLVLQTHYINVETIPTGKFAFDKLML